MQAALSLRSMRLYAEPVSDSRGWSGSGRDRARTHYPTRGMSPARPRGHGRQSVPLLSASALSRSILLRACQFSEFPKLLLLFGHYAVYLLFLLFICVLMERYAQTAAFTRQGSRKRCGSCPAGVPPARRHAQIRHTACLAPAAKRRRLTRRSHIRINIPASGPDAGIFIY